MGHSFSEMVFPGVVGNAECIDGNKWVRLYCLVHLYLCPPALCTLLSITSSPSLPSHPWVGLNFSRKLYYLYLVLPPTVPYLH